MTSQTTTTTRTALTGVALFAIAGSALADVPSPMPQGVHTYAQAQQIGPGVNNNSGQINDSRPDGTAHSNAQRSAFDTTVTSDSVSEFGLLTSDLSFGGLLDGTSGTRTVRAFGESGFRDETLFLDAPGLAPGATVSVLATFDLDMPLLFELNGLSGSGFGALSFAYDFNLTIAGTSVNIFGEYFNRGLGTKLIAGTDTPGEVTLSLDVPVGESFVIEAMISAEFEARANNASFTTNFATSDDAPTFRFLGFEGLPDGALLSSESGAFGTEPPIPAPGAMALALLGGACTARRRRRD